MNQTLNSSVPYGFHWWQKIISYECSKMSALTAGDYVRRSTTTGAPEKQEDQDKKYEQKEF